MDDERERNRYRFSGYTLPMITLDETGPSYVVLPPHPDFCRPAPHSWVERGSFEGSIGTPGPFRQMKDA